MRWFVAPALGALLISAAMARAQGGGRQPAARPAEKPQAAAEPAAPAETVYLSPSAVRDIQTALEAAGHDPGAATGVWSGHAAEALMAFQSAHAIEPSGHVDLRTLVALKMSGVIDGQPPMSRAAAPPAPAVVPAAQPAEPAAAPRVEPVPLFVDPVIVAGVQQALLKSGVIPDNVLGFWRDATTKVTREYQRAHNLDPTGTVDLQLIHALGLDGLLAQPPAKGVEIMSDSQAPFAGVPLAIGPTGLRRLQQALEKKGFKTAAADGRWTDDTADAVKRFQEANGLDATGRLDPTTIRALGFEHPLVDLARASDGKS